jgi:predicted NUDIX family NTP pyrophosphohydrolase
VVLVDGAAFEPGDFEFGEFELEWPPRSGKTASFPEVDRAEWMPLAEARVKLVKGQRPAIDALEQHLAEVSG